MLLLGHNVLNVQCIIFWAFLVILCPVECHRKSLIMISISEFTLGNMKIYLHFLSLSHPSLGWLYVFCSFPPPRPPPPPQRLLLLTSKPFQLHLRYLGQRKYRSGKMYWMTFWWPWPKVTAVTLINTNLLVCRIKWEPLIQSLQNLVTISLWSCLSPD